MNPYLMLETLAELVDLGLLPDGMTQEEAQRRAVKGIAKGLLKTLSKMGISTIPSYCGAQIFEAVGLAPAFVERHFTGTASRIGGIGIGELARETLTRHARAYPGTEGELLPVVGLYAWRRDGSITSGTRRRSRSCSTPSATGQRQAMLLAGLQANQGRGLASHFQRFFCDDFSPMPIRAEYSMSRNVGGPRLKTIWEAYIA